MDAFLAALNRQAKDDPTGVKLRARVEARKARFLAAAPQARAALDQLRKRTPHARDDEMGTLLACAVAWLDRLEGAVNPEPLRALATGPRYLGVFATRAEALDAGGGGAYGSDFAPDGEPRRWRARQGRRAWLREVCDEADRLSAEIRTAEASARFPAPLSKTGGAEFAPRSTNASVAVLLDAEWFKTPLGNPRDGGMCKADLAGGPLDGEAVRFKQAWLPLLLDLAETGRADAGRNERGRKLAGRVAKKLKTWGLSVTHEKSRVTLLSGPLQVAVKGARGDCQSELQRMCAELRRHDRFAPPAADRNVRGRFKTSNGAPAKK